MPRTAATTPEDFLRDVPDDRRADAATIRDTIRRHLPDGYVETVRWGMLNYEIPLEQYPDTYNGQPLGYLAFAVQKNHFALYMTAPYMSPEVRAALEAGFRAAGRKLDMGKSCVRFRTAADLPLDVIGDVIARTPPARFIELYEASRRA